MVRELLAPSYYNTLQDASDWWNHVNYSDDWQNRIYHLLAALYAFVAAIALVISSPIFSKQLCLYVCYV